MNFLWSALPSSAVFCLCTYKICVLTTASSSYSAPSWCIHPVFWHSFSSIQQGILASCLSSTTAVKTDSCCCKTTMSPTRPNLPPLVLQLEASAPSLLVLQHPSYGGITFCNTRIYIQLPCIYYQHIRNKFVQEYHGVS